MSPSIRLLITAFIGLAAANSLVFGVACCAAQNAAPEAAIATSIQYDPQPYEGQTTGQWIELLATSTDSRMRVRAAEALGAMARNSRLAFKGFSDVPRNLPQPPPLSEEALRPLVAALIVGLSDSQSAVRASSAIALSWVGPRAKVAVPALVRQLDDADVDARKNALTAIGSMESFAKEAIPRLQALLMNGKGSGRLDVAKTLRLVGADPDTFVPTLLDNLADGSSAIEFAHAGDAAVPALLQALKDKDANRRKFAAYAIGNMAGWQKLTKNQEAVADALISLTQDESRDVVWHAVQAIGSVQADPERCVPALVGLLKHSDKAVVAKAVESLGDFHAAAKSASPALLGLLGEGTDDFGSAVAVRQIGIDMSCADIIRKLKLAESSSWLLVPLFVYPEAAIEFLRLNPQAVNVPTDDRAALVRLMREAEPSVRPQRDLLYQNQQLPLAIMAELGDPRFLPLIERRVRAASAHEKTQLAACARACGAPADRVVTIDDSQPGDFKPKSAWPGANQARLSPTANGHGDGFTEVIITGQILRADGRSPAFAPKFYRINDAMLLGKRVREEESITYDAKSGRFVFVTIVFAAYSSGEDQPEPGPYQTGSTLIQIESTECEPLQVQFYDEMPDVRITLPLASNRGR